MAAFGGFWFGVEQGGAASPKFHVVTVPVPKRHEFNNPGSPRIELMYFLPCAKFAD